MKHWLITGLCFGVLTLPVWAAPLRTINDYLTGQPLQTAVADGTVYEFRATVPQVNFWKTPAPLDGLWIESANKKTLIWMSSTSGTMATDTVPCPPATGSSGVVGGNSADCLNSSPAPPDGCVCQPGQTCCPGTANCYDVGAQECCGGIPHDIGTGCCVDYVWHSCTPPTITCPSDIAKAADAGNCSASVTFSATANDICNGSITPTFTTNDVTVSPPVIFPVGITTVKVTANNSCGKTANCTFKVTVDAGCPCSTKLSDAEWADPIVKNFPNMVRCHTCKEANATPVYNCLAWTIGDTTRRWWDEADANHDGEISATEMTAFLTAKSIPASTIAYYGPNADNIKHVAKKAGGPGGNCSASSKLGSSIRISHDLHEMEGGPTYFNTVGGN